MITVGYAALFLRQYNKLPKDLRDEVDEKIELFRSETNHRLLKVRKLKGPFSGSYSFSISFRHRILFQYANKTNRYDNKKRVVLLSVGGHELYQ